MKDERLVQAINETYNRISDKGNLSSFILGMGGEKTFLMRVLEDENKNRAEMNTPILFGQIQKYGSTSYSVSVEVELIIEDIEEGIEEYITKGIAVLLLTREGLIDKTLFELTNDGDNVSMTEITDAEITLDFGDGIDSALKPNYESTLEDLSAVIEFGKTDPELAKQIVSDYDFFSKKH
jgi:hypothetical protein